MVSFLSAHRRYPIERMIRELGVRPEVGVRAGLRAALDGAENLSAARAA